ncbi:hypothetical protein GCM10027428_33520 [Haliea atlantica]
MEQEILHLVDAVVGEALGHAWPDPAQLADRNRFQDCHAISAPKGGAAGGLSGSWLRYNCCMDAQCNQWGW